MSELIERLLVIVLSAYALLGIFGLAFVLWQLFGRRK